MKKRFVLSFAFLFAPFYLHDASAQDAPPAITASAPAKGAPAFSGSVIGKFSERVAALYAYDLDGDGKQEIIAGFDASVAVFKLEDGALRKIARKDMGARSQVTGVCAGDFNGGVPAIYVNKIVGSAARGEILSFNGGSLSTVNDGIKKFFICGGGGLYWQEQKTNGAPRGEVMAAEWKNGEPAGRRFITLPDSKRLSGITIFDIDGDGAVDAAGFDKDRKLVYHSSAQDEWVRVDGEFGGSDITIRLEDEGESEVHHELQPAMVPLGMGGKFARIAAPQNQYSFTLLSPTPNYGKSRMLAVENKGLGYEVTASTPVVDGVINAVAPMGKNSLLAGRSQKSMMGAAKSEILLITLEGF